MMLLCNFPADMMDIYINTVYSVTGMLTIVLAITCYFSFLIVWKNDNI
jgi:hypothetical protein